MGRGGRSPKPIQLAILHGNPGQRAIREAPVTPNGVDDLWKPPDWMDDDQRAQWIHGIEHAPRGLLTETDRETFTSWVCASVEYVRSMKLINLEGQVSYTPQGRPLQNPRMRTAAEQANLAMKASDRLGFSPGARASLGRAYSATTAPGQLIGSKLQAYLDAKPDKLTN